MISEAHLNQFSQASVQLYRPGLGLGNYAERAFGFLSQLVSSEFIVFGALDLQTKQMEMALNASVPTFSPAMEAFGELMTKYPLFRWDPEVNLGKPFTRSDFYSRREFAQTDIFAEVYDRLGIDDHCAIFVPGTEGEVCFFGVERYKGQDFSAEERTLLEFAQNHLGNARELAKARDRLSQDGARPEALVRAGLTVREADVLMWLAEGKSNEEIAILLRLQLYTVKGYVKTIFQKIAAPNRLAAALWALRVSREDEVRSLAPQDRLVTVSVADGSPD
ncbi:response regulator transcription factor [Synoicihabitans lomoniglobus]|uniref:Helix-turn-helix transcriptional regulator n=1 Tax=Synoicihabitans lomoniglobus TaxID=2909285 RepID=A0AAF0CP12_9BACT|nr:helix-turn-helix transcriptional regulator [Opitutaceae bacterium LMO-M01]WED65406.1 helix-turn-helix transcriptional regulator [Opitutaceae bacterium LMO-M01]